MTTAIEMSKTYQYRKVMKPMLERKRRARINKCLDELKDIMVSTLESEGEHVTRLEKADILELTVQHLQKLRKQRQIHHYQQQHPAITQAEGFRSGYIFAANEVSRNLAKIPGVNIKFGSQLMTHLGLRLNQIQPPIKAPIPIHHPISVQCNTFGSTNTSLASVSPVSSGRYSVPLSPISNYSASPQSENGLLMKHPAVNHHRFISTDDENVWRPW